MDQQQWSAPGFYGYYPDDPHSQDRANTSPSSVQMNHAGPSGLSPEDANPRRYSTQSHHSASLPSSHYSVPPPLVPQTATPTSLPHSSSGSGSSSVALPSFSTGFYSPYHSHSPSTHHTAHVPHTAHVYPAHLPYSTGSAPGSYHMPSPMSAPPLPPSHPSRQPPIHHYADSPRLPHLTIDSGISGPGPGGGPQPETIYRSPPAIDHLSPVSPLHPHMTGVPSTASSGSSYYPPIPPIKKSTSNSGSARGSLRKKGKRREASPMNSSRSWSGDGEGDDSRAEDGPMPWGMPQDEYKALNPKDKKQVRNRIGARRFRAKRKDYVATLEASARVKDDQIAALQSQLEVQQNEINDYRHQLGLPLVQHKIPSIAGSGPDDPGGLGLMVPMEEWVVGKVERE